MDQKDRFGRSAIFGSKDFGQMKVNDSIDAGWGFSFFWKLTEGNLAPRPALNPCYDDRNFCWDTWSWKGQLEKTRSWEVWSSNFLFQLERKERNCKVSSEVKINFRMKLFLALLFLYQLNFPLSNECFNLNSSFPILLVGPIWSFPG